MNKRKVPVFSSEAEEAAWWYRHRRDLEQEILSAARKGRLKRLTRRKLLARLRASTRVISIRVPEDDLAMARKQAAARGLPYQTYLKSLLHQALRKAKSA